MTNNSTKYYIGATEGTFKESTYGHKLMFSSRKCSNITTVPAYIWKLKDSNITPSIAKEVFE